MSVAVVEQARQWASVLIEREARGPGDFLPALSRVASRLGVSESFLRALRYRTPKDISATAFEKLRLAYEAELRRQEKRFEHELGCARAMEGATDSGLVRAAIALAAAVAGGDFSPAAPAQGEAK